MPSLESVSTGNLRATFEEVDAIGALSIGIIAFVVGYVLTGLAAFVGEWPTQAGLLFALIIIGFTFYSAHNVQYIDPAVGPTDLISQITQPDVPLLVYYAIPILVLLVAGILVARRSPRGGLDPVGMAASALSIAIGYGTMAVLGTFVFTAGTRGGETARIATAEAALFGFLYPLVFGAIGVAIVQAVDAYRAA